MKTQKFNRFHCKKNTNTVGQAKTELEDQLPNGSRTCNKSFFKHIRIRKSANDYVESTDN